ncbi:SgcJ/EcaC family oxidoreductase [Streptomyces sp. NPDC048057]|uniref:SgcJ/EcaC family oxidoreductase n=1 Tax=Streptomyces sp. NPDC048057 TaxID=3155628 RepID=UPI0033D63A99
MAIDEVMAELERAWNAADGAAWAEQFEEDADYVDALGRIQKGRAVIAAEHQKILDTVYRGSRLRMRLLSSRALGDGVELVHSATTLDVPAGPRAGQWHSVQTQLFRDGRVLAFHNTLRTDVADFSERDEEYARLSPLDWQAQKRA